MTTALIMLWHYKSTRPLGWNANNIHQLFYNSQKLKPKSYDSVWQGLLQYFNLVEGCLTMIQAYQHKNNFTYDWIIRTRVDGYWNSPLSSEDFIPRTYLVPSGSSYGGLNDRFGLGDYNTSVVALSRLSLIPELDAARYHLLNSEGAFKAQLTIHRVPYISKRLPFCVVSDRSYDFPPPRFGVPVAALSSPGPLSGAKCRPCTPPCTHHCVGLTMNKLYRGWSWTDWTNNTLQLCDAHAEWESGWEKIFDQVAGNKLAAARQRVENLKMEQCVKDFAELMKKTAYWEAPPVSQICRLGLSPNPLQFSKLCIVFQPPTQFFLRTSTGLQNLRFSVDKYRSFFVVEYLMDTKQSCSFMEKEMEKSFLVFVPQLSCGILLCGRVCLSFEQRVYYFLKLHVNINRSVQCIKLTKFIVICFGS